MKIQSQIQRMLMILVAAAAVIAVWHYLSSVKEIRISMERTFSERVHLVSTYVSMVQQQVDGMARSFEHNYGKCSTGEALYSRYYGEYGIWGLYRESDKKSTGSIAGTCTGTGSFPLKASEINELAAAISVDSQIRSILDYNKNVIWIYYTSAQNFIYLAPKLKISEYRFSLSEYKRPFWYQAAPEKNPSFKQIITDLYEDSVGKGLMITISSPVKIREKFAGVMSLDIGIDLLKKLALTGDLPGETILADENGKIVVRTGDFDINEVYPLIPDRTSWYDGKDGYFWMRREVGSGELNMLHRIKYSSYYAAAVKRSLYVWSMAGLFIFLFVIVNRDLIIRRKEEMKRGKAEQALLESETRLQAFMDNVPALIIIKDHKLRPVFANATMMQYFPIKEWFGKTPGEIFPSDVAEVMIEKDTAALNSGSVSYEETWTDRFGEIHNFFTQKFRIERPGKEPMIGAIITDITKQVKTANMLKEKETTLSTLISNLPGFIYRCTFDRDWTMVFMSDVCEKITGYRPDELINNKEIAYNDLIHPDYREMVWEASKKAIIEKKAFEYEYPVITKNGDTRWVWERGRAIYSASGEVQVIEGFITDITDHRLMEAEKDKLQDQLNQSQKMESVGRLAGGVAHDFNNMLGVIIGEVELAMLKSDPESSVYQRLVEIKKAARRSADLTAQLLAFARKQTVNPRIIDLNKAISGIINMLVRLIGEEIELIWLPGNDLWPVKIDPSQIDQILANLCVNARDAITGAGRISIETSNLTSEKIRGKAFTEILPGDYVVLTVRDTGSGFSREVYDHLFEPFFTTKDTGKGTGLGLAMVYGIVRQNNGHITVESSPGSGTTFRICFPRSRETAEKESGLRENVYTGGTENEKILLVEDEPMLLEMSRAMLAELGYSVIAVSTSREALSAAEEYSGKIKLLLTDVIMPVMNGRELAENLIKRQPGLRLIYMSGYPADFIARHGVLEDGVNFIQKPFNISELASVIKKALS